MPRRPDAELTPNDEALMSSCLHLVGEHGFRGATTREIARRAGVNEVTLFRRFSNKTELVKASLAYASAPIRPGATAPTDDLEADLVSIAEAYSVFVHRWPKLVARVLAELSSASDVGRGARTLIAENAVGIRRTFEHHIEAGRLSARSPDEAMVAFVGPLLVGATLGPGVTPDGSVVTFDATTHVQDFLDGRRA